MNRYAALDLATNLDLEAERKASVATNRTARVKIERGHAWMIRILPFSQGPLKKPFAQLAQHWIAQRPVYCKKHTADEFGGDPNYDCPICAAVDACKNEARDDQEWTDFNQIEARVHFRCYCLVLKKSNDRNQEEDMSGEELLTPHEFNIPKNSFAPLHAKIERSKTRKGATGKGLLDLESGTDLWAIRDKMNNLTFELSEDGPQSIFTLDEEYDERISRVWKQLRQPQVRFLADDRMEELALLISEKAFEKAGKSLSNRDEGGKSGRGARGGARGRFHESDEETPRGRGRGRVESGDEQEEAPRGPGRPPSAGRSTGYDRARAALGPAQGDDDDQLDGAEIPARPAARAAGRPSAAAAEPEQEPSDGALEPPAEEPPPVTASRGGALATPAAASARRVSVPAAVTAVRRANAPVPPPVSRAETAARIEDDAPGEGEPAEEAQDPAPAEKADLAPVASAPRAAAAGNPLHAALRKSITTQINRGR